ncbi:MAG TPA: hypothetical protein VGB85_03875 [Nannocystis sp.]|jgi:hypothetical protein
MRAPKQSLSLILVVLAACPGSSGGETGDDSGTDSDAGTTTKPTSGADSTGSTTDPTTGTITDPTTGTTAEQTTVSTSDTTDDNDTTGAESLCDAAPSFPDPGSSEYLQWVVDGEAYLSLPPPGGAYFFNSYLSVALYSSDFTGSLSFGSINSFPDGISAGTYPCSGTDGMFVNGGALGLANGQAPQSSCVIRLTEDLTDGGRIVGSLSARLVDISGNPTTCVDGRFELTDAAP